MGIHMRRSVATQIEDARERMLDRAMVQEAESVLKAVGISPSKPIGKE